MLRMKIIGVILLVILSSAASFAQDWPKVRPMEAEVGFDTAVSRFDFRVPIYSENGELLYWFLCKGGNTEYLDSVKGGNYVGPLSCRLDTENREGDGSYLAEGDEAVWHTRGQIGLDDLVGQCGKYPEYGRIRHFRLRGFELTMTMKDLVVEEGHLKYFIIKISVEPDSAALTAQSEQIGYLNPGTHCEKFLKGNEPRYCRNPETSSWELCKK